MVHAKLPTLPFNKYKYQLLAAVCANIISLSHGAAIGWLSPVLLILQSPESPLASGPVSVSEASWLGSIFCLGGMFGNFFYGFVANNFGRKTALCLLAIPQTSFWLTLIFGNHINYLYLARILAGVAGGGSYVSIPLFVSDIASNEVRGSLGAFLIFGVNIGTLLGFVIGAYLSYQTVPRILIALPILFFVSVAFLPETPQFLIQKQKEEKAKKSISFYQNLQLNEKSDEQKIEEYLQELNRRNKDANQDEKLTFSDFVKERKAIIIGIGIVSVNILSGCFAIITYTATVFQYSGSNLDPNLSAIVVAVVQVLGTYFSTLLIDRLPRKVLFYITLFGTGLGLIATGFFSFFQQHLLEYGWLPTVSLSFGIFIASAGLLPLTFVVLAEILPAKIRPLASSTCNCVLNILAFGLLKVFPILFETIQLHGVMWICGGICIIGIFFILLAVPETRGKDI